LGLLVSVGLAVAQRSAAGLLGGPPYGSLLGLVSGWRMLRGSRLGLAGAALFYALQVLSYFAAGWHLNIRSGLSYAAVLRLANGTLVINLVALAGLMLVGLLWLRR
jgi:hypothetical protein